MNSRWTWLMMAAAAVVVLGARGLAPSDLHERDQPKTVAYTADVVVNGRWVLPRDPLGEPATKPPMYNWIGAAVVKMTGRWDEWVLRAPSVLTGLATLAIAATMAMFLARRSDVEPTSGRKPWQLAGAIGAVTGAMWLANHADVRAIYEARPNMVLTGFLTAAWALAVVAMESVRGAKGPQAPSPALPHEGGGREASDARSPLHDAEEGNPRNSGPPPIDVGRGCAEQLQSSHSHWRRFVITLGLWLCVAGAALAKGPAAFLIILYIPLAAWLIYRSKAALWHTGIAWGLPLAVAIVVLWMYGVGKIDNDHLWQRLLGQEVVGRTMSKDGDYTWLKQLLSAWKVPLYFLTRFAPWSVLVVLALYDIRPKRPRAAFHTMKSVHQLVRVVLHGWLRHPLGPAILWVLMVIGVFCLVGNKKATYILPAYGPAAIIAAWWLLSIERVLKLKPVTAGAVGLVVAIILAAIFFFAPRYGETGHGENLRRFAAEVERVAADDAIVFVNNGYTPLQAMLGRHQGEGFPSTGQLATARWIVMPYPQTSGTDGLPQSARLSADQRQQLPPMTAEPELISDPVTGLLDGQALPLALFKVER